MIVLARDDQETICLFDRLGHRIHAHRSLTWLEKEVGRLLFRPTCFQGSSIFKNLEGVKDGQLVGDFFDVAQGRGSCGNLSFYPIKEPVSQAAGATLRWSYIPGAPHEQDRFERSMI